MKVEFKADHPVTDASCKSATGKTMKEWFAAIDKRGGSELKRRDAINWLYEATEKDAWWSTTLWVEYERAKKIVNKKDGLIEGYNICVTKTIKAPLAQVYAAMTELPRMREWFGDKVTASVEEGGTLSDQAGNSGQFLRVRDNKDLRFTWKNKLSLAPSQVDVALADKGSGKTGITLNHQRIQNRDEADGLRQAWSDALDRLKAMVE